MTRVPPATTPTRELVERWLPSVLGAAIPAEVDGVELSLGILLEGNDGGEWILELCEGRFSVRPGSRETAAVTWIQTVDDFGGMLRGERGGVVGRRTAEWLARSGEARSRLREGALAGAADRIERLSAVDARVRVRLTGEAEGDWSADLMLGRGAIPARPHAALSLTVEVADALAGGGLDALQAVLTGRIAIDGDLGLLLRIVQS